MTTNLSTGDTNFLTRTFDLFSVHIYNCLTYFQVLYTKTDTQKQDYQPEGLEIISSISKHNNTKYKMPKTRPALMCPAADHQPMPWSCLEPVGDVAPLGKVRVLVLKAEKGAMVLKVWIPLTCQETERSLAWNHDLISNWWFSGSVLVPLRN